MNRLGKTLTLLAIIVLAVVAAGAASGALRGLPILCTGGPCSGTPAADEIQGSNLADDISALGGNDEIIGNDGNDVLRGGAGADETEGGDGDDRHLGGKGPDDLSEFGKSEGGSDVMKGGKGPDFAEGNQSADLLVGGKGNERFRQKLPIRQARGIGFESCYQGFCTSLFGDTGNDTIKGGKGADYMEGEQGTDELIGGAGDDVIDAANDDTPGAKDKVSCGDGKDVVFADPPDKVADDCEKVKPPQQVKPRAAARDSALARGPGVFCTGGPCTGTQEGEMILGSGLADQIKALGGVDSVIGNEGNDIARAGKGNDYAEGSEGKDVVNGGKGSDRSPDTVSFRQARRGGPANCFQGFCSNLFGDEGNDTIKGGKGADHMEGEEGRDEHFGGDGADVIDAANEDTPGVKDKVVCGDGRDVVFANPADKVADDCEKVKPPQVIKTREARRGDLPEIDCTGGGPCVGTAAAEFMQGGDLEDQISALGGDDEAEGEGGVDLVKGGGGEDILEGGDGADVMRGGAGDDRGIQDKFRQGSPALPSQHFPGFFGDAGNDKMFGGAGNDYLEGEEGRDEFTGGAGKDYLDAINDDATGTPDKLNCGKGFDRYSARPEDKVDDNCEKKIPSPPEI